MKNCFEQVSDLGILMIKSMGRLGIVDVSIKRFLFFEETLFLLQKRMETLYIFGKIFGNFNLCKKKWND